MASIPEFFIVEQQFPLNSISYTEAVDLPKRALSLLIVYQENCEWVEHHGKLVEVPNSRRR